jgi:thioredoxin-like negative regulator of GroEL
MTPIVNGLEDEFGGEITVVRLNATDSESAALQSQYGLRGHPSFLVLNASGDVVERFFGPQNEEALRAAIELALESSP